MNKKISKTIGVLLLLTAVAVTQVPVSDAEAAGTASDFQMEGNKLLRYSGTAEVVSIPDDVQIIGEEAFANNNNIVKVNIEGKVKQIENGAFANCDYLRTVNIGDGVEQIDAGAFSNDTALTHVSVGSGVKKLGSGVFAGDKALTDFKVSDSNPYLFMEDGILYGKDHATLYFLLPSSQKESLNLTNDVKTIMAYAFWGNDSLKKVQLGSGLYEVPSYAFSNCSNLTDVSIHLPTQSIGAKAFEDCVSLQHVEVPESVTNIQDTAFDGCPYVNLDAKEGSYAWNYAQTMQKTPVDQVEYADVQQAQTVQPQNLTGTNQSQNGSTATTAPAAGGTNTTAGDTATATASPDQPETTDAENSADPTPVPTMTTTSETVENQVLLGQSSIVTGRALVFIDNGKTNVQQGMPVQNATLDLSQLAGEDQPQGDASSQSTSEGTIGNLLADNAEKGKGFPKYTVVQDKIASQAYYQNADLTSYEIPEGITEIGDFAFARSGLESIVIPEGVTKIGYGAFYHCDNLQSVQIPSTVTEIDDYAFAKTPFLENNHSATYPFVVAGDGILIGYLGSDSIINIPGGVKQISDGVFRDHMGITAVNLPDTVETIGEDAFKGCHNLTTVNGGKNVKSIGAGAFQGCALSNVTISSSVEEIGIAAYDLSGGTDTVTMEGTTLPKLTYGTDSSRALNKEDRTYVFSGNLNKVIVPTGVSDFENTILQDGIYGYQGSIYDEQGTLLAQNQGVSKASDVLHDITIPGSEEDFILHIRESEDAAARISDAYGELYGGRTPSKLQAYEISLMDQTDTVPIHKLGKQTATVELSVPEGISTDQMHVVTLDEDGQLEAVNYEVTESDGESKIRFTTSHFSPYGIYEYDGFGGTGVVSNGKAIIRGGIKDNTPDTGDLIHPKWFLALGLAALACAFLFYKGQGKKPVRGFKE